MSRKPLWKPSPDPMSDLELALSDLRVVGSMLVTYDVLSDPDEVSYLKERVIEHVGRANAAFAGLMKARLVSPPAPREEAPPRRAPLSPADTQAILAILDRNP